MLRNLRSSPRDWGLVTITLHWLTAILIFITIPLGIVAENWHLSPTKLDLFVLHKSLGLLILAFIIFRIIWRLFNSRPDFPRNTTAIQYRLAISTHYLLYLLLILLPVSGWVINDSGNFPYKWFWLIPMPDILAKDTGLKDVATTTHTFLVILFVIILLLHVIAALRHHFVLHDNVLMRMLGREKTKTK
ncbi:MAG: cytochrome b, partial [Gammaproteobacteria bacterium]